MSRTGSTGRPPNSLRRHSRPLRLALLAAALAAASGCRVSDRSAADPSDRPDGGGFQPGRKILLMHYMPWYETPAVRGQWSVHWKGPDSRHRPDRAGANGLPDIWSHFHPLIGPYDSTDPAVLECHLLQMKLAGVDGVIADWYGIGPAADHPSIHAATRALFAAAERFGMTYAACYEDRTLELMVDWKKLAPGEVTQHLAETFHWMQAEWFPKPGYARFHNRPLLLNFGPIYLQDSSTWSAALKDLSPRPALFCLHHLWKRAGADGGFSWIHWEPWDGDPGPDVVRQRLGDIFDRISDDPERTIVSAYPGFRDVYAEHHRELDHRDGAVLRDTLDVAMQGPWPLVQLVTWNDYGEGTMIEPTHEFGYRFLEVVQEARHRESGGSFPFAPDDLRLPARLLALRRAGSVPGNTLDRVAELLSRGAVRDARADLSRLEAR